MRVLRILLWLAILLAAMASPGYAGEGSGDTTGSPLKRNGLDIKDKELAPSMTPDLSSLNVRLSSRTIRPPDELVKKVVVLEGLRATRPLTGEPTMAAILEDDARHRVIVLSAPHDNVEGQIRAYLLYDVDIESHLPQLTACCSRRHCAEDRTPGVGGLGCIAFCLVEALRE